MAKRLQRCMFLEKRKSSSLDTYEVRLAAERILVDIGILPGFRRCIGKQSQVSNINISGEERNSSKSLIIIASQIVYIIVNLKLHAKPETHIDVEENSKELIRCSDSNT